jgi:hypothetical protein
MTRLTGAPKCGRTGPKPRNVWPGFHGYLLERHGLANECQDMTLEEELNFWRQRTQEFRLWLQEQRDRSPEPITAPEETK